MRTFSCPICDQDISESFSDDDPDVGLVGGWYCERCDEGFGLDDWCVDDGEPLREVEPPMGKRSVEG